MCSLALRLRFEQTFKNIHDFSESLFTSKVLVALVLLGSNVKLFMLNFKYQGLQLVID